MRLHVCKELKSKMCDVFHILQLEVIQINDQTGVDTLPLTNFQTGTGKNLPPLPLSPGDPESDNTGSNSGSRLRLSAVLSRARIIKITQTQAVGRRLGADAMVWSGPVLSTSLHVNEAAAVLGTSNTGNTWFQQLIG